MVKNGEAAGPAVILPELASPHPLVGRQVLLGPGLGPVLLCSGHFLSSSYSQARAHQLGTV